MIQDIVEENWGKATVGMWKITFIYVSVSFALEQGGKNTSG